MAGQAGFRLRARLSEHPEVTVTFFRSDEKEGGGRYETQTGRVRRLDEVNRTLILTDGTAIDLDAVVELQI